MEGPPSVVAAQGADRYDRAMTFEAKNRGWSASEYSALAGFAGDWRDSWWHQDFLELMASRLQLDAVSSMLDVGCGAGHWGVRLLSVLPPDATLVGVDYEADFLAPATERAARFGVGDRVDYQAANADELPFADNSFDLVTCQTVLMHVPNARTTLTEMFRVTKLGGVVLVAEPDNLANGVLNALGDPRLSLEDRVALVRFDDICHRGKIELGSGDHSIGGRLPGLFAELGVDDVRVHLNDRCSPIYPPYDDPDQKAQLEQWFTWIAADVSPFGKHDDARATFIAGGGDAAEFETLWDAWIRSQKAAHAGVEAKTYRTGGGHAHYLTSGRKRG